VNRIKQIIDDTIGREGRYSNNPKDSGGETMWGITAEVARRNGWTGRMRDLPREVAVDIYTREYLILPGFDKLVPISASIAEEVFDTGVNTGVYTAGKFLQRALNLFNKGGSLYPDLRVDGSVGPYTREALVAYLDHRGTSGELVLLRTLNCFQGEHYAVLCERHEKNEEFIYGWMFNRVV